MFAVLVEVQLTRKKIPIYATYNEFDFSNRPAGFPDLDLVSERFISPRIAFMQIRRLRHGMGQFGITGQVINVPVSVDTMIEKLPSDVDDHCSIAVHIKRKLIHKSSFLIGLVKKSVIKAWLRYLITTALYRHYNINIDEEFLQTFGDEIRFQEADAEQNDAAVADAAVIAEDVEKITIDDNLFAQQQTLLWNEDKYLQIAPGEKNVPKSLLFVEHAEELTFPAIYLGQLRNLREGFAPTPYEICSSELRRADRRAVTPQSLLYKVIKIMRLRVRDSLQVVFKNVGKGTNLTELHQNSEFFFP